ncbi:MAG: substrate-binding domain-containing protein [Treponema sp.]|nr:substrate-binding domain-containing protein [Treponema sp.]
MKAKNIKNLHSIVFFAVIISVIVGAIIVLSVAMLRNNGNKSSIQTESNKKMYHILILGEYENEHFLREIYEGASTLSESYNMVLDFYVPKTQAEEESLQELFDYASYVNADGIIAYIDSPDNIKELPRKSDGTLIPLVSTGQYSPTLTQISFIGNSYWELGKKIAEEAVYLLNQQGTIFIINNENNTHNNYRNLMNSLFDSLNNYKTIKYTEISSVSPNMLFSDTKKCLLLSLSEEDTIQTAQAIQDFHFDNSKNFRIMGFGSNETCQFYLQKEIIQELISLDPEKIGQKAIQELFEYFTFGYANSYIAADVKITRGKK